MSHSNALGWLIFFQQVTFGYVISHSRIDPDLLRWY